MSRNYKLDEYLKHLFESVHLHALEDYPQDVALQIRMLLERALTSGTISDQEVNVLLDLLKKTLTRKKSKEEHAESIDEYWDEGSDKEEESREEQRIGLLLRQNEERELLRSQLNLRAYQRALIRQLHAMRGASEQMNNAPAHGRER